MVLSTTRWVGKVAIVTGASAGIGAAICEKLVSNGMQVLGLVRRKEKVEELSQKLAEQKGKLHAYKTDLSEEEVILDAFKWAKDNLAPIHALVNNAGIVQLGSLTKGDTKLWKQVLDLNVLGLCIGTREAIRDMRENNVDGHIIHINSIAGHKVYDVPCFNISPASKFAVTALTESLRLKLKTVDSKIKVTSISPGATETEIVQTYSAYSDDPQLFKAFKTVIKTEDIADAVEYTLSTPPHVQVHELTIKPINEEF